MYLEGYLNYNTIHGLNYTILYNSNCRYLKTDNTLVYFGIFEWIGNDYGVSIFKKDTFNVMIESFKNIKKFDHICLNLFGKKSEFITFVDGCKCCTFNNIINYK